MRGPWLSGPLAAPAALDALARRVRGAEGAIVVVGPVWLGSALASEVPTLLLVEAQERTRARRAVRRAAASGRRLASVVAGEALPIAVGSVGGLVIEGAAALEPDALGRWMTTLIPALRPGGRLVAIDATDDPAVESRLTASYLGAALRHIAQERPRRGVLLTVGVAPEAAILALRFPSAAAAP